MSIKRTLGTPTFTIHPDGAFTIIGTIRNDYADEQPRVELVNETGNRGLIRLFSATRATAGQISSGEGATSGNIRLLPTREAAYPERWVELYIDATQGVWRIKADEIELQTGTQANGKLGQQVPNSVTTAGDTWGIGVQYAGVSRTINTPSSITIFAAESSNNVASTGADTISTRGFRFTMVANTSTGPTRWFGAYVTVGN